MIFTNKHPAESSKTGAGAEAENTKDLAVLGNAKAVIRSIPQD